LAKRNLKISAEEGLLLFHHFWGLPSSSEAELGWRKVGVGVEEEEVAEKEESLMG
jgi:hypothetical protein